MDLVRQHVCQGFINHAMPLQPAPTGKLFRLDPDQEVPGATARACVTGMPGTVISHRDLGRGKGRLKP